MTLEEFVATYNGRKVDFDGCNGAQCVDLFRQYNHDVWKNPRLEGLGINGGAKDLYLKHDSMPVQSKVLKKVKSPAVGDAAVWGATEKNPYGHVAIVVGTLGKSLVVFEQNGFSQNGAVLTVRSKNGLLGGLRKR